MTRNRTLIFVIVALALMVVFTYWPKNRPADFEASLSAEGRTLCDLYKSALNCRLEISRLQVLAKSYQNDMARQERILEKIDEIRPSFEGLESCTLGSKVYTRSQVETDAKLRQERLQFLQGDIEDAQKGIDTYCETLFGILSLIQRSEISLQKKGLESDIDSAALVAVCLSGRIGQENGSSFSVVPGEIVGRAREKFFSEMKSPIQEVLPDTLVIAELSKSVISDEDWFRLINPDSLATQDESGTALSQSNLDLLGRLGIPIGNKVSSSDVSAGEFRQEIIYKGLDADRAWMHQVISGRPDPQFMQTFGGQQPPQPSTGHWIHERIQDNLADFRNHLGATGNYDPMLLQGLIRGFDAMPPPEKRQVTVDRFLTVQQVLEVMKKSFSDDSSSIDERVAVTMPLGQGKDVTFEFFKLGRPVSDAGLAKEYEERGLAPDPYAQALLNNSDLGFCRSFPNATHWQDSEGKWCHIIFQEEVRKKILITDPLAQRIVVVGQSDEAYGDNLWFAGVSNTGKTEESSAGVASSNP